MNYFFDRSIKHNKHHSKQAFSLVEMILAMGLLALLSVLFATLMVFAINMSSNASGRTENRLNAVGDSEIIYLDENYNADNMLTGDEHSTTNDYTISIGDISIPVNRVDVESEDQNYSAFYYKK